MTLNFEKDKLISELNKRKPKKVLIQLAEGIKQNALEIFDIINKLNIEKKLGIEVVFSGESAWGGCSVSIDEAKKVDADLIIHFGHAPFINVDFPVVYIEVKDELDLSSILKKSLKSLKGYKKIGLSYSIQHKDDIENVKKFYEENGKEVTLSKKLGAVACEGHVVGCQYAGLKAIENDVECFVILGNQFHSMGAVLSVEKPVFLLDVYNNAVRDMEGVRDKILRQRAISIEKIKESESVGIIIGLKPGQKFGSPDYLVKKFKEEGKKVILISMDEITPDKLMNFYNIKAFVELACPRIAVDDFSKYGRAIVTYKEALVALGIKSWEDALKEGII